MSKIALSVEKLTKIYSSNKKKVSSLMALNNVSFEVKQGEVFGLLGPNGAGKTTFLSILAGTVVKTEGKVNVWGFDLDANLFIVY
jgi:ABC-2 type transport system ATP-binding protein